MQVERGAIIPALEMGLLTHALLANKQKYGKRECSGFAKCAR